MSTTAKSRLPAFCGKFQCQQCNQIASIGVEYLFVSSIRGVSIPSHLMAVARSEILDMRKYGACYILFTPGRADVGRYTLVAIST